MNYNKKTVYDIDVVGKKVLLRCDFNVPQDKATGAITSDKRIVAALPTIRYLLGQGAAVIACSHLGKPEPSFEKWVKKQTEKGKDPAELTEEKWQKSLKKLTLAPVAERLSELLGKPVIFAHDVVGPDAKAKAAALKGGEIMLLENTRFEKGETKNDPALAKELASMAEVYVSDAFGSVHRAHASTAGVAAYLPAVSPPCRACSLPRNLRSWARRSTIPSARSSRCSAAQRSAIRSPLSTTCSKRPTPSSSAAAWPTPSPRRRAARSASLCSSRTSAPTRSR